LGTYDRCIRLYHRPVKLTPGQSKFVFMVLVAIGMSFAMSLVMSLAMLGLDRWTLLRWLKAWGIALLVGVPAAQLMAPIAQRLTAWLTRR